jgi:hypothetical protein
MHKRAKQTQRERLLEFIRMEVDAHFEHAVFRRALELSVLTSKQKQKSFSHHWSFAIDYALNVMDAVREFAGLLTQGVIARQKRITNKAWSEILEETLKFAARLIDWEGMAGTFVATSLGLSGKDPEDRVAPASRAAFEKQVVEFVSGWQIEASNAITLRCMLFDSPSAPAPHLDNTKLMIMFLKMRDPKISHKEICAKMDGGKIPPPATWQRDGDRTWMDGYRHHPGRVKTFLSKIKPLQTK